MSTLMLRITVGHVCLRCFSVFCFLPTCLIWIKGPEMPWHSCASDACHAGTVSPLCFFTRQQFIQELSNWMNSCHDVLQHRMKHAKRMHQAKTPIACTLVGGINM